MRRPRRHIRLLITAAIAGPAVSVAIAWTLALVDPSQPPPRGPQHILGPVPGSATWSWYVNIHSRPGQRAYIFRKGQTQVPPRAPMLAESSLPSWARPPTGGMKVDVRGFGWPWPCLHGAVTDPTAGHTYWEIRPRVGASPPLRLPVQPIPAGMAINSLVWTAAIAAVSLAATHARATHRRRRGRCAACGYDLAGTPAPTCPECGSPRPP